MKRKEEEEEEKGGPKKMLVGSSRSGSGHVGPAESDRQLQVLLLLQPQPP